MHLKVTIIPGHALPPEPLAAKLLPKGSRPEWITDMAATLAAGKPVYDGDIAEWGCTYEPLEFLLARLGELALPVLITVDGEVRSLAWLIAWWQGSKLWKPDKHTVNQLKDKLRQQSQLRRTPWATRSVPPETGAKAT